MASSGDDSTYDNSGPFLQEEIASLKGLELIAEQSQQAEPVQSTPEPVTAAPSPVVQDQKPAEKKPVKPKWLKLWNGNYGSQLLVPFWTISSI